MLASLKVTGVFAVLYLPLSLVIGFAMALLMNQRLRGMSVFRTIYYLPSVLSGVAVAVLWQFVFHRDFGVLNWFVAHRGVPVTSREAQYGIIPYLATGKVLPEDTVEAMEEADAILWGATGGPETKEVPPAARKAGSLLSMRSKYDLYANLRPIVASPALADSAPLKAEVLRDVDFVIIRELTSGIYFGEPRGIETLPDGQRRGFNTEQYTTNQVRRVARSAFELARIS